MKKSFVLILSILSLSALLSFSSSRENGRQLFMCGPGFDSAYNQSSSMIIDQLDCKDPYQNHIYHNVYLEPGDNLDISDSGSLSGLAGGVYVYYITLVNPTSGSIKILDQYNNVIDCKNTSSGVIFYHVIVNATCNTFYRIVLSDSSC